MKLIKIMIIIFLLKFVVSDLSDLKTKEDFLNL